jgi:hypothetical protein
MPELMVATSGRLQPPAVGFQQVDQISDLHLSNDTAAHFPAYFNCLGKFTPSCNQRVESRVEDFIMRITLTLALTVAFCGICAAQSWQPPTDAQRCPSKWGAGDQRGSGNLMKPQTVLKATRLIKTREVIELGHVLDAPLGQPQLRDDHQAHHDDHGIQSPRQQ